MFSYLQRSDLPFISSLQPSGWSDIVPYFEFYLGAPFCFPVKIMHEGVLSGVGNAIVHGETGWLSHIIVHPEKRNLGIGSEITSALTSILFEKKCETLLLIATALGEPVYKKIGFQSELNYLFFKNEGACDEPTDLVDFSAGLEHEIYAMDKAISGENRKQLLYSHLPKCKLVVDDNKVTGCYFPTLGEGLIIADNTLAGITLLNEKHKTQLRTAVPENNLAAITHLQQQGFEQVSRGSRMYLGKKIIWHPNKLYSRIGGNLG